MTKVPLQFLLRRLTLVWNVSLRGFIQHLPDVIECLLGSVRNAGHTAARLSNIRGRTTCDRSEAGGATMVVE
jgi:hypothetical protein